MSGNSENMSTSIPDSSEKQCFDDDKIFESTRTDSGFISGSNILSEEITDTDEFRKPKTNERDFHEEDKDGMFVDSGVVVVSENLSCLSLQDSNLNDLSSKSQKPVECSTRKSQVKQSSDIPWKLYYQQDEDGDTYLHMAILHGLSDLAYTLIRKAPHPRLLDTPNDDALTPLHLAVAMQQWQVARWLIVAGARPGVRNLTGDSPVHLAAKKGDVQCCKAILYPVQTQERDQLQLSYSAQLYPTYDVEQWNYDGETCVHVAAQYGHVDVLRHLVWYGANINAREGRQGYTALHYAVERNDENLIKFLLNECDKINLDTRTYGGNSALQLGLSIEENIVEMLRQRGVASACSSEDEYSSDSEDEISFEKVGILVNANA